MIHLALPQGTRRRRLPFYLAMEEWAVKSLPEGEYFFAWNVEPTVICGRHQDIPLELDLAYCQANGIDVVRRKSGGGCVYADLDNLMLSFVSADTDTRRAFGGFMSKAAQALRGRGILAEVSGRNDILIGGRKVSGGAFFRMPGRSITHCTMLVSTDLDTMSKAITPDRSKLLSHKVQSVKSHVTTLKEYGIDSVEAVATYLVGSLTDSEITLTAADIAEIEAIEKGYYDPEWLRIGETLPRNGRRIEGVGSVGVRLSLRDGTIEDIALNGDFLPTEDFSCILARCKGLPLKAEKLQAALQGIETTIPGLSAAELANLIIEESNKH